MTTTLWAVSDLHAAVKLNGPKIDDIQPTDPSDWLIVAGDVAERFELIVEVMTELASRFDTVIWVPGNHELFCRSADRYRGREKYAMLVQAMRAIGVITPEDRYPVFGGVTIAPLFTLYDYSFRSREMTVDEALQAAHDNNCLLYTSPKPTRPY